MDENEPKEEFQVKDKRRFTPEGETKEEPATEQKEVPEEGEKPEAQEAEPKAHAEKQPPPPPIDFATFVLSLANSALFQLGLIRARDSEEVTKDLQGARQTIDLIAMLEEKTRGNLTEQEARIVKETLFQLRMAFVDASK